MSAIVNDRDVILQGAALRFTPPADRALLLTASSPVFKALAGGGGAPAAITFTASLLNMTGDVLFSTVPATPLDIQGNAASLAFADMAGNSVTVTASITRDGRTYQASQAVVKVTDGATTYTWIRYADTALGGGISDDPAGKLYIGLAYNRTTPDESSNAGDYSWSLIRGADGAPGNQGVPGVPGADGVTTYTWIKYSDNANGAGMYDLPTANTLYIGIAVNKTLQAEGDDPAAYVWSKFRGDQGVPGVQGQPGVTTYMYIKYAPHFSGSGMTDYPESNSRYLGISYGTTPVESTEPSEYTWSLYKGADGLMGPQGPQGIAGVKGADGIQYYIWIKYSDSPDGAGMYDVPTANTAYIGISNNQLNQTEGNDPAAYTWSKFKGDQGVPGAQGPQGTQGPVGPRGADGSAGRRGSVTISQYNAAGWNDTVARDAVISFTGEFPVLMDTVTLYANTSATTKFYNGSGWSTVGAKIDGNLLVTGTVGADSFVGNAFTGYTFTGAYFQTASAGQRIVISASSNDLRAYSGSALVATIGGSGSGHVYAANTAGVGIPAMWVDSNSSSTYGITVQCNGGSGVFANAGGASAIIGTASSGIGGRFTASTGSALSIDGRVTCTPYAESAGKSTSTNNCIPVTDNTFNLGTYAARWMNIVSATPVIVSSDARMKSDVQDSDLGLDFIASLRPVSYKLLEGRNEITHGPEQAGPWPPGQQPEPEVIVTPVPGTRRHYGLLAQEVKAALGERDAAFWTLQDPSDPQSAQALRYEELIAPLIKAVQELRAQVIQLQNLQP